MEAPKLPSADAGKWIIRESQGRFPRPCLYRHLRLDGGIDHILIGMALAERDFGKHADMRIDRRVGTAACDRMLQKSRRHVGREPGSDADARVGHRDLPASAMQRRDRGCDGASHD